MNYMVHSTDIIGYVGEAEILCLIHGDPETMEPVFAGDEDSWNDSCGSCHIRLSEQ